MIELKNLSYKYKKFNEQREVIEEKFAINNIDLKIKKGEFIAILGRNGSGKSTLSKHLNVLLKPSSGNLNVDGLDANDKAKVWDIRKKIGMAFQNPDNQIIATTIEEDIAFGPENLNLDQSEIKKRVDKYLKLMGMEKYRKSSPENLSGGQKQKVVIAGVLAMEPKYLVLDEPTSMLDPIAREEIIKALIHIRKTCKTTIILITHYMEEVVNADKIVIIDDGKIKSQGTPRQIFNDKKLLEKYNLEPPYVVKVAQKLKENGIILKDEIITKEELIEQLCQLD